MKLDALASKALARCRDKGWGRDWESAGCYLHLEASEFTEALRGKKGVIEEEAADVLFVLFSTLEAHGIKASTVLDILDKRFP